MHCHNNFFAYKGMKIAHHFSYHSHLKFKIIILQGSLTLLGVVTLWTLARPVDLPRRARLAINCALAMGGTQVGDLLSCFPRYSLSPLRAQKLIIGCCSIVLPTITCDY